MYNKVLALLAFVFFVSGAHAAENTYKIKQVITTKKVVVVSVTGTQTVPKGKTFLVTFPDGEQCTLESISSTESLVTLNAATCDRVKQITLNSPIEPSLYEEALGVADVPAKDIKTKPQVQAPVPTRGSYELVREISDYAYFTPARHFGANFSLGLTNSTSKIVNGTTLVSEGKGRKTKLGLELSYGVTNNINLSAIFSHIPNSSRENQPAGSRYTSKGLVDPAIGAQARLFEQSATTPFDLITAIVYSPKMGSATSATLTAEGNVAKGRDILAAAAGISRKMENMEFALLFSYTAIGDGTESDATTGVVTDNGAREVVGIQATAQFRLTESFFLLGGLTGASYSGEESLNRGTNTSIKAATYTSGGGILGVSFVVMPDRSLIDLRVKTERVDSIDITSGTTKLKLQDSIDSEVTASVKFQF